jgi:hypothetical protein
MLNVPRSFFVTFASFCSRFVPTGQRKHRAGGTAGFDQQRINGASFILEQKSTRHRRIFDKGNEENWRRSTF